MGTIAVLPSLRSTGFGGLFVMAFISFQLGCAHTRGSAVGPARASVDEQLFKAQVDGAISDGESHKALTRSQKVVYGSNYLDFYATFLPNDFGKTCFSFRIETDDNAVQDALKWDAYLKRQGYADVRVNFESFVPVTTDKYPLLYAAKGCANDEFEPKFPIYFYATANFKPGIEPIRLEWYLEK
jgi:hypothetical protein